MYRVLLIVFLFLISVQTHARLQGQDRIDSLLSELPSANGDTNHVNLLSDLSFSYFTVDPDFGIEYGKKAIDLAKDIDFQSGLARAYSTVGINYSVKSNYSKTIEYWSEALRINEELNNKAGIASILGNMGIVYRKQSDYAKSLEYYERALKINEDLGDKVRKAKNLGNMGVIYMFRSNYDKALECYNGALKINEEMGNEIEVARNLGNIGSIYTYQSKYSEALGAYLKSLKTFQKINDKPNIASILGNIGSVYDNKSEYKKSLEYLNKSLKIFSILEDKNGIAKILGSIGTVYFNIHQVNKEEKNVSNKSSLDSAIMYLNKSNIIYEEIGELDDRSKNLKKLAELHKSKGDHKRAYFALEEHKLLQDSVFNIDKEKEIANLTAVREKEVAEKELVISKLENDQRKQESYVLYGGLTLLALVVIVIFRQRRQSEKLLLNILPAKIAKRLKRRKGDIADDIENASTVFIDLVGFTEYSKDKKASDVLMMLNQVFSRIDKLVLNHGLEKIKTIGDGYMAAAGVPEYQEDHSNRAANFALDVHKELEKFNKENGTSISARIGIESGPMVAGVIGDMKFIYDLWGDSVNTASRMESTGTPNKVHITENFKLELEKNKNGFAFSEPIEMDIKGKGKMKTYYIESN